MRNVKRLIIVFVFMSIIMFFFSSGLFSQTEFRRSENGSGDRRDLCGGPIVGEIVKIDYRSMVILTSSGDKKQVFIDSRTTFVREVGVEESEFKVGDNILVIGQSGRENVIRPMTIRILDVTDNQAPGLFRAQGFGGSESPTRGPKIGTVKRLEPLTVELNSGETKIVQTTGTTRMVREILINSSEVQEGMQVRVIGSPQRGTGITEARKVILLSEGKPLANKESPSSSKDVLLRDLPQQPLSPDFIYGIWLGRGLYSNDELDRTFKVAYNLGIKYFKVEFKWDYVEPENGKWQWDNERALNVEHVIELAKQYSMSIIPYFDLFMPWAEKRYLDPNKGECEGPPSRRGQYQAPDPEAYAEYVYKVVDKLKRNGVDVKYIELDNEVSNLSDGYHSWNCFINMTAKQIKKIENAAYDKIKPAYPNIMVSSTTFSFPGLGSGRFGDPERDKKRRNNFIRAYFEDSPKPKFDFLGIHEVLRGSGNPYTTLNTLSDTDHVYNFGSYYDAYNIWRKILNKYGYKDKPIFNTESAAILKGEQDAQLLQRAIFARTNASQNKVSGWILSQLSGSKRFTEGRGRNRISIGIIKPADGYRLREGYYGYYTLMTTLAKYPNYEGKVMGELNSQKVWVEKFSNKKAQVLYTVFIPYGVGFNVEQTIHLKIGPNREAKIRKSDTATLTIRSNNNGYIKLAVTEHPVFVECQW